MTNREECAHCQTRMVRVDRPHWRIHMNTNWQNVPEDYAGCDSQGTFAVGPRCRRFYPHAFRCENPSDASLADD